MPSFAGASPPIQFPAVLQLLSAPPPFQMKVAAVDDWKERMLKPSARADQRQPARPIEVGERSVASFCNPPFPLKCSRVSPPRSPQLGSAAIYKNKRRSFSKKAACWIAEVARGISDHSCVPSLPVTSKHLSTKGAKRARSSVIAAVLILILA